VQEAVLGQVVENGIAVERIDSLARLVFTDYQRGI